MKSNQKENIKQYLNEHYCIDIPISHGLLCIENRPSCCDRGRYIVKVFSDNILLWVDDADGFPRYYFNFDCMIQEVESWMAARNQEVVEK